MQRTLKPIRVAMLVLAPFALSTVCLLALYNLQIVQGEIYYEQSQNSIVARETVPAVRGNILDRYGRVLISNRISYNVTINRLALVASSDPNGYLLKLADYAKANGIAYNDTLPLSVEPPFAYITEMTDIQQSRLSRYKEHFALDGDEAAISGEDLFKYFKSHYSIPKDYTDEQARIAVGIRYELELRSLFDDLPVYYFATGVDIGLISVIEEQRFPGVSVVPVSEREYHTPYAAHILGYVGSMSPDEYYELYGPKNYPMNAIVGKDGFEKAFEDYLRGTNGERVITRNASGAIANVQYSVEPQSGSNITLTLDIDLQQVTEEALGRTIELINSQKEAGKAHAEAGAAVVMEVKTGDILSMASYPTYNLASLSEDIGKLLEDPTSPLFNRATQGVYEPGSTFKVVTAIAALNEGAVSSYEYILDESIYTKYSAYEPTCWIYPGTHGHVNVVDAITVSCNYFFYEVGIRVGNKNLAKYAQQFGLGMPTGIEIYEETGIVATEEYKLEHFNEDWYYGDTMQTAMGQLYNVFTPVQLASYVTTIANNGTRLAAHFLKNVKSSGNAETLYESQPEILSVMDVDREYFEDVQEGMLGVSRTGTASEVFGYYELDVASKTGTVQLGKDLENNAVFIAYAPYDDPQIAVAIVVEKGEAGAAIVQIAKSIFDYYFSSKTENQVVLGENALLQ